MKPFRPGALPIALAAALWLLAPGAAWACSVCSAGRDDETRVAFLATTGLLSVLPLLLVGGLVWWLRRRARELAGAQALVAEPQALVAEAQALVAGPQALVAEARALVAEPQALVATGAAEPLSRTNATR